MAKRIYSLSIWLIIIGFFLPFINTCDPKTTVDKQGDVVEIRNYSLSKPDGINHSGIGYMIDFGVSGNGLFYFLLSALLIALYLAVKTTVLKIKISFADIGSLLILTGFFTWLFFEDQMVNLRYGAIVITTGYLCAFMSGLFIKLKSTNSA